VTLLYCVRTSHDVMFQGELEALRTRLKSFQYHLLLSHPHADWSGPRGHVSREFIDHAIKDLATPDFFLCGPPPFMDASRAILTGQSNLTLSRSRGWLETHGRGCRAA
jgi:ferredoxin-NADP reductase